MTSSVGNIFHLTGPLCGEFTSDWRIPCTKAGSVMFSLICASINGWVNNREAGNLRRHRAHYDVIVMGTLLINLLLPSDTIWHHGCWSVLHQAITWSNVVLLSVWSLGANCGEILIKIQVFSFTKWIWKYCLKNVHVHISVCNVCEGWYCNFVSVNWVIIGLGNALSPVWYQTISWSKCWNNKFNWNCNQNANISL